MGLWHNLYANQIQNQFCCVATEVNWGGDIEATNSSFHEQDGMWEWVKINSHVFTVIKEHVTKYIFTHFSITIALQQKVRPLYNWSLAD